MVNFVSKNPTQRPKFIIDKQTDPILTGSRGVINSPGSVPGASTQQCRVERVKNPATYITEIYTETQTPENLSCKRVLRVTYDPERDGCDQGDTVPNNWASDMATSFTPGRAGNYILQLGTIADNYWDGWGAAYDRNLTSDIRDVGLITRFALARAVFDDWLMAKVNDNLVYVGPRNGDCLEIYSPPPVSESSSTRSCMQIWDNWGSGWQYPDTGDSDWWGGDGGGSAASYQSYTAVGGGWNYTTGDCRTGMVQYYATCFSGPGLSTGWSFGLNIDMKPYFKDGSNTVFMRTIVAGGGERAIRLMMHQLCLRNCYDQWGNNQCAPLERRAQ